MPKSMTLNKILADLTGEPRFDVALRLTAKDAVEHRLEAIRKVIGRFEKKYKMNFKQFKKKWEEGKIGNKYSYEVEKDYWEWEAALTRQKSLEKIKEWLG